jgi:hypothetical protein
MFILALRNAFVQGFILLLRPADFISIALASLRRTEELLRPFNHVFLYTRNSFETHQGRVLWKVVVQLKLPYDRKTLTFVQVDVRLRAFSHVTRT